MLLLTPRWVRLANPAIAPVSLDRAQVKKLEALRREVRWPHDAFATMVAQSEGTTRIVQRNVYERLRSASPGLTPQQLLRGVLESRASSSAAVGLEGMTAEEIEGALARSETLDDVCDIIIKWEKAHGQFSSDPWGVIPELDKRITQVLLSGC